MPKRKKPIQKAKSACLDCKHYFVTWDYNASKGCKAYGFKSSQIPSILVKQSTGSDCLQFEQKKKNN